MSGHEIGLSGEETLGLISRLLDSKLDKKFSDFKRDLEQREQWTNSQIKKLKTGAKASSSFHFKGNKLQFEFNSTLLDYMDAASDNLHEGNLSHVTEELEKTKTLLNKRNKVIRSANKSPAGWAAVQEYESDELADDSDDEKKLRSAERRAVSKLGTDEYCNFDVGLFDHFNGIEEKDLLERSYEDYLEGSESVIVKGRLKVNVNFRQSISASHFVLGVVREGYKIPFYYSRTSVRLPNNKSVLQNSDFVLALLVSFLRLVQLWSVLLRQWLCIRFHFSFSPMGRKGSYWTSQTLIFFFVKKSKIKFEDAKSFLEWFLPRPCAWACSFDI